MSPSNCTCPRCAKSFKLPATQELPARVKCSRCATKFRVNADGTTMPVVADHPTGRVAPTATNGQSAAVETAIIPPGLRPWDVSAPGVEPVAPERSGSIRPLVLGLAAVVVLAVVAGVGFTIVSLLGDDQDPTETASKDETNKPTPPTPKADGVVRKPRPVVNPAPLDPRAKKVNQAIDKGVEYLKGSLTGGKQVSFRSRSCGAMALAGLTLLSCGVPATDPAVVQALQQVRAAVPRLRATYEMAICIWFLDRLNDPRDRELIKTLALRLVAGQTVNGGWNYTCQPLSDAQQQDLHSQLEKQLLSSEVARDELTSPDETQPVKARGKGRQKPAKGKARIAWRRAPALPANLKDLPVLRFQPDKPLVLSRAGGRDDNSLTQFVILALWAAQKHGVPAERSLVMAEARFRACQSRDGSWGYMWMNRTRPDSMTCAGLLGLAVGRGVRKEARGQKAALPALVRDPAVRKGLAFLGKTVGKAPVGNGPASGKGSLIRAQAGGDLYFLWSLERVSVVYNLKKIAGKDWYAWGSEILVATQHPDGRWTEAYPGVIDTCFALLFLKRVNVVTDLTNKLQLLEGAAKPAPAVGPRRKLRGSDSADK